MNISTLFYRTCYKQLGKTFCNGPLRPGKAYCIKFRAFTEDAHLDSACSRVVYTGGNQKFNLELI